MSRRLCLFEDEQWDRFLPLVWTRPVYGLRCGFDTLEAKIRRAYAGIPVCYSVRKSMAAVFAETHPGASINVMDEAESILFVNGRILPDPDTASRIPPVGEEMIFLSGDTVVAARLSSKVLNEMTKKLGEPLSRSDFGSLPERQVETELVGYPWELVLRNGEQIEADFRARIDDFDRRPALPDGVQSVGADIALAHDADVKPGVVLDASDGPILIDGGAEIMPLVYIQGPAYIGRNARIKALAKIYEGTTVGPVCKVGGEVEESIIHGYSNKQHEGFIGHAYLGEWVNLGADTNNSDLKNNYGNVKVYVRGEFIDSGQMFVGLTMGDHSKSGINTMFNTGTVVGVCCNVYGADFPPKFIPSFSWGGGSGFEEYDPVRALDTARQVMNRRKVTLSNAYESMLMEIHTMTASEREAAGQV